MATSEDNILFNQLAIPRDTTRTCAVRTAVMNNLPENEQALRWAVEDLKLLGITKLEGLHDKRGGKGTESPGEGVDAVVYAIPGMNMVVRFTARDREYNHADRNSLLGTTRPDSRYVMQNFMEFSVPNPNGQGLYIEIGALGKDVGQFSSNWNARRLKWNGITGENRQPGEQFRGKSDFAAGDNNKSFGGVTKLVDTGEMDQHCYRSPSQSTEWAKMDEYKELTAAAKRGAWFTPDIHHQLYERQLKRDFDIGQGRCARNCKGLYEHYRGNDMPPEEYAGKTQSYMLDYIGLLTTRFGPSETHIATAADFLKEHSPQAVDLELDVKRAVQQLSHGSAADILETVLRHGLKKGSIGARDIIEKGANGHSVFSNLCTKDAMVKAVSCVPGIRETEQNLTSTYLANVLALSKPNGETLRFLCHMEGADLTRRSERGAGYLDYVASKYWTTKAFEQRSGEDRAEDLQQTARVIADLETIMREKGLDPMQHTQADGSYQQYAKVQSEFAEKEKLRGQVARAWSQMHLP